MLKWLLLALLVILGGWLALNLERYHTVVHEQSSAHHYAAAAELLAKRDIDSRRVHSAAEFTDLPGTDTLLIFASTRAQMTRSQIDALHQWVREGGRLVLAARMISYFHDFDETDEGPGEDRFLDDEGEPYDSAFYTRNDALLYSFGVTGWHNDYHGDLSRQDPMSASTPNEFSTANEYLVSVCLTGEVDDDTFNCELMLCGDADAESAYAVHHQEGGSWRFDLDPHADLLHRDFYQWDDGSDPADYPETPATETRLEVAAGNRIGDQLLLLNYGDGEVWVLSDLRIFENTRLYHLEHAWLLNRMASNASAVWWVQSVAVPPLTTWLWLNAWPAISAFALLLALFIWQRLPRRGVIITPGAHNGSDFLAHLRAGSRFLWQTAHQRQATLEPLRQQVRRLLARHKKARETEADADIAARISGLEPADIRFALDGQTDQDDELLQIVKTLQKLRSRL